MKKNHTGRGCGGHKSKPKALRRGVRCIAGSSPTTSQSLPRGVRKYDARGASQNSRPKSHWSGTRSIHASNHSAQAHWCSRAFTCRRHVRRRVGAARSAARAYDGVTDEVHDASRTHRSSCRTQRERIALASELVYERRFRTCVWPLGYCRLSHPRTTVTPTLSLPSYDNSLPQERILFVLRVELRGYTILASVLRSMATPTPPPPRPPPPARDPPYFMK